MNYQTEFLIVGAGIAGLSVATGLEKLQKNYLIIDKMSKIQGIGAGLGITSNAIAALQILGVADDVINVANPLSSLKIVDERGKIIVDGNPNNIENYELTNYALHRADLHDVLCKTIPSTKLLPSCEIQKIDDTGKGLRVICKGEVIIHCQYIIGADGIHSSVRQHIFPNATIRYAGYTCWRSVVHWDGDLPATSTETWGKDGRFGLTPLSHNRLYWYACVNTKTEKDPTFQAYTIQDLQKRFSYYHNNIIKALQLTIPNKLLLNDICDLKPLNKYHSGNIVLIGDAAHATTPNLGQGACMGIEDAAILFQELQHNSTPIAFSNFSKRRVDRCKKLVNTAWQMGKIAQLENPQLIAIRNFISRKLPASLQVQQLRQILDTSKVL